MTFDNELSWKYRIAEAVKKVHSRLYCSRKPRSFDVREDILRMFYTVTISGMTCRGGNTPKQALDTKTT